MSEMMNALAGLGTQFSQGATGFMDERRKQDEVLKHMRDELREQASKTLAYSQKMGGQALDNGNGEAAAGYLNQVPELEKASGLGAGMGKQVVGSPVLGTRDVVRQREQLGPAMPGLSMPTVPVTEQESYDTGKRDFSAPEFQAALRGLSGSAPPKMTEVSPGATLYNPITRKAEYTAPQQTHAANARPVQNPITGAWFIPAPGMKTDIKPPSVNDGPRPVQNPVTGEWFVPSAGMRTDPQPLMMPITGTDGSIVLTPVPRGKPVQAKPSTPPKVRTAVELERDAVAEFPETIQGLIPPPLLKKRSDYKKKAKADEAAALEAWKKRNPSTPGGAAQPAGNPRGPLRNSRSSIPAPVRDEDVALLPAFEAFAQEAVALAPGTTVTSRARSEARNAKAKPGGGAKDSWHMHRQAFDLGGHTPAQAQALRAWANQRGLYMIDEGNHLHFQPVQGVSADEAPHVAAFYSKYGISEA